VTFYHGKYVILMEPWRLKNLAERKKSVFHSDCRNECHSTRVARFFSRQASIRMTVGALMA
jgi:hypothetical protein